MGFSGNLGVSDALYAEHMGILRGLLLAWEMGIRTLVYYSESVLTTLNLISNPSNHFHLHAVLIQSIKDVLRRDWTVTLLHSLREGNCTADCLAKLGGAQSEEKWKILEVQPVELATTLALDASGVAVLRF